MGNVVTIYITADNGLHVAGFSIHPPYGSLVPGLNEPEDHMWSIYDNDGKGNGNHLGSYPTFTDAMNFVNECILVKGYIHER